MTTESWFEATHLKRRGAKKLDTNALTDFNSIGPDFVFKIGDTKDRMLQLEKSAGPDDAQLARLETRLTSMSVS